MSRVKKTRKARQAGGGSAVRRAWRRLKRACRENRAFRTFWQAVVGFLVAHLPTFWDGSGDFKLALKALLTGAVAAGLSAIWKTAEDEMNADWQE